MGTPAGAFPPTEALGAGAHYEPTLEWMERSLKRFPHDPSFVTEAMVRSRHEAALRQGGLEAFKRLMPAPPAGGETPMVRGVPADSLATLSHHVLVLHGREDQVVPPECGMLIHRSVRNSELHMFGQCGHWVQIEQEQRFLELTDAFLPGGAA